MKPLFIQIIAVKTVDSKTQGEVHVKQTRVIEFENDYSNYDIMDILDAISDNAKHIKKLLEDRGE